MVEGHLLATPCPLHTHTWPLLHQNDAAREANDFIEQDRLTASAQQASRLKKFKEMSSTWQEEVKIQNLEACFSVLHSQAYIYTYIHTYIHTCIHTYKQTVVLSLKILIYFIILLFIYLFTFSNCIE